MLQLQKKTLYLHQYQPPIAGKYLSPPKLSKPTSTLPQISPQCQEKKYLHPNHQNPPAQYPRSAPDGEKIAISTRTIKTSMYNAPNHPPMAGKQLSPPKTSKPTCTEPQVSRRWQENSYLHPTPPKQCPRSAPDGGKIAMSTHSIKTHLYSAQDQPPMAEKSYLHPNHQNQPVQCPR
jgi:hypothetical protein